MQVQRFSAFALLTTLVVCACAQQQDKEWGFIPPDGSAGTVGGGGSTGTGGTVSSGGAGVTGGATASGGTAGAAGVAATGGSATGGAGGTSTGGTSTGGTSTGGTSTGGTNTGGTSTGGTSTGGTSTGGTSTGGTSTGGTGTGGAPPSCSTTGYAFCDDFESDTLNGAASGWTVRAGTWSVVGDASQTSGDQQVYRNTNTGNSSSQAGTTSYTDATIQVHMKINSFSSASASNAAGIFMRFDGTNDFDLSVAGDGNLYLRRTLTSSTSITCSSGTTSGPSGLTSPYTFQWFTLKLSVSGSGTGIAIKGYIDTGNGFPASPNVTCNGPSSTSYQIATGTAGVFAKGNAPAEYDDVLISTP